MPKPEVALVGEGGQSIGSKPRSSLNRGDIYHGIFVLLVTPTKGLVVSMLPGRPQKLGASGMAIRQAGEEAEAAARRALPLQAPLHHLGDQAYVLGDRKIYASVYYAVGALPAGNDRHCALTLAEIDSRVAAGTAQLTPAFAALLTTYRHLLPL